ncbi:MAG: hypothetical protein ND895_28310 [Pyrinomonadaceae bacterium]|nr:hypothetical protein [Pyrinomonadaceae bacterium]
MDFGISHKKVQIISYSRILGWRWEDVSYSGLESIEILDKSYSSVKYEVYAEVEVQTFCAIGTTTTEVYETVPTKWHIFVVNDPGRTVHDSLVQSMYDLWNRKELFSGQWFYFFGMDKSNYLLTAMPGSVNVKGFYFVWVNGRVMKFQFAGFDKKDQGGFGQVDSFTKNNLRIKLGDAEVEAYRFPLTAEKHFLRLYRKGYFRSRTPA